MKYIASCSCGKDSLAMILTILEKKFPLDYVLFFDAGKEFNSIYRNWDKLTKVLDRYGIRYERLTPDRSFDYYFSEHEVKTRSGKPKKGYSWCGGVCRWMTTLKIDAINRFYRQFDKEVIVDVGIASDERERIQFERSDRTIKVYPLIMLGMTENDCLVKCYKSGFNWTEANGIDLYDVLDRVSCYCCRNKNLNELRAIYRHLPQYWQKLEEMQAKTKIPFRAGETIQDLESRFKTEVKQ